MNYKKRVRYVGGGAIDACSVFAESIWLLCAPSLTVHQEKPFPRRLLVQLVAVQLDGDLGSVWTVYPR